MQRVSERRQARMWQGARTSGAIIVAGLALTLWAGPVQAASEVAVGGYHDQAFDAAQLNLLARSPGVADPHFQIKIGSGPSSALTAFTPRLGGLGLGALGQPGELPRALAGAGSALDASTAVHHLQLGLGSAEIAGWSVDLAATAGVPDPAATAGTDTGLMVGGELAVSGLRFDAAYGEDATLMGLDGTRMTAGVAYGIGPFDTRMSYSLVERETTVDTSLFTVGSRLSLKPGLVVQGDVAYADDENGDASTAGRISLQFNF